MVIKRPGVALALGAVLAAVAVWLGAGSSRAANDGPALRSLSFIVQRPDGPAVQLAFEVRASSEGEALDAARRAAAEIVPGGTIASSAGFTAAWARWSWLWDDNELPVPIAYNPNGAPPVVSPQAIAAALQSWSSAPGSKFAFRYAGITDREASLAESGPDGENVISWRRLDCSHGCVLGITSKELAHEADLVLNSDPAALIADGQGDTNDARTVILHETGHMAGLEHSCPAPFGPCTDSERAAVMYFQYRGIHRKLGDDDIAGITALYPRTNGTPSPSPAPPPAGTSEPPKPEFPVILEAGWNLVQLPSSETRSTVTALGCVAAIYDFRDGAWSAWLTAGPPATQSLTGLDAARAYWVLAARPCAHVFGE